jgi:hypothetical protein
VISGLIQWFTQQKQCCQNNYNQKGVDKNIVFPKEFKERKILDLSPKDLSCRREASIICKSLGAELNNWQCTKKNKGQIEHEGTHVSLSYDHWVQTER